MALLTFFAFQFRFGAIFSTKCLLRHSLSRSGVQIWLKIFPKIHHELHKKLSSYIDSIFFCCGFFKSKSKSPHRKPHSPNILKNLLFFRILGHFNYRGVSGRMHSPENPKNDKFPKMFEAWGLRFKCFDLLKPQISDETLLARKGPNENTAVYSNFVN